MKILSENIKELKKFALQGNVIDMAVGIIIGTALGKVIDSLVKDIIMPPLGWLLGRVDFSNLYFILPFGNRSGIHYSSLEAAQAAGAVTINYGLFINTVMSFLIIVLSVFLMVKMINKLRAKSKLLAEQEEKLTTKQCPRCFTTIDIKATKCPNCTIDL